MPLPELIHTEKELEDTLAAASDADVQYAARLNADVLVLGAGGKMGPSLARRVQRAFERSGSRSGVIAASRFSSPRSRLELEAAGIRTVV